MCTCAENKPYNKCAVIRLTRAQLPAKANSIRNQESKVKKANSAHSHLSCYK